MGRIWGFGQTAAVNAPNAPLFFQARKRAHFAICLTLCVRCAKCATFLSPKKRRILQFHRNYAPDAAFFQFASKKGAFCNFSKNMRHFFECKKVALKKFFQKYAHNAPNAPFLEFSKSLKMRQAK